MTRRWAMAQNCYDVLSILLESTRSPGASHLTQSSRVNLPESIGQRGRKRAREDLPLNLPHEHAYTHARMARQQLQTPRPSSASMTSEDCSQSILANSLNSSQHRTPRHTSGFNECVIDVQNRASAISMNSYDFSILQQPDASNTMLRSSRTGQYMQPSQQENGTDISTIHDLNCHDWSVQSHLVEGIEHIPTYDVFDGAMWGPLLELIEPNG